MAYSHRNLLILTVNKSIYPWPLLHSTFVILPITKKKFTGLQYQKRSCLSVLHMSFGNVKPSNY